MQKRRGRPVAAGGGRGAVQPAQTIASAASAAHVRPPRDRPSDSRLGLAADFLSFDPAPCVQIQGSRRPPRRCRRAAGGGHRRRADGRGPHRRPPRSSTPRPRSHRRRDATRRGSAPRYRRLTSGDAGCRRSSSARRSAVRHATAPAAGPPEHPVDHRAVIGPPATPLRGLVGQQRFQPGPFLIGQIVSIEHAVGSTASSRSRSAGHALIWRPSCQGAGGSGAHGRRRGHRFGRRTRRWVVTSVSACDAMSV